VHDSIIESSFQLRSGKLINNMGEASSPTLYASVSVSKARGQGHEKGFYREGEEDCLSHELCRIIGPEAYARLKPKNISFDNK
jgi:hypothetical protein